MTQERANELLALIRWESGGCLFQDKKAPPYPEMTPEERAEVKAKWDTMPGHTCFHDAVLRIYKGQ